MKIETEFNIGDEVWIILWLDDGTYRTEVIGPRKVHCISVFFRYGFDKHFEYYEVEEILGKCSLDQVFKTREAAEITAEALNK